MGGLAHYLEQEGVPATQISLLREHTEKIKPPRALWVPFDFGRPLGVANDPAFQTRVLVAALKLFESPAGPVLADFPEDEPEDADRPAAFVCPVNFPAPITDLNDSELLRQTFQEEIRELRSWYDLGVRSRGRTTVGVSGIDMEAAGAFIAAFLNDEIPPSLREDIAPLPLFKLAIEDLKAYYFEAIAAQPGQQRISSKTLTDWFWRETAAAKVLFTIQDRWKDSANKQLLEFSRLRIVPRLRLGDSPYLRK